MKFLEALVTTIVITVVFYAMYSIISNSFVPGSSLPPLAPNNRIDRDNVPKTRFSQNINIIPRRQATNTPQSTTEPDYMLGGLNKMMSDVENPELTTSPLLGADPRTQDFGDEGLTAVQAQVAQAQVAKEGTGYANLANLHKYDGNSILMTKRKGITGDVVNQKGQTGIDARIGFAFVPGKNITTTTGGGNASPIEITSGSDFEKKVSQTNDEPTVFVIKGNLKLSDKVKLPSNITLIGDNCSIKGPIILSRINNVIITNILFEKLSDGDYDGGADLMVIESKSHHIWIHKCTFEKGPDGLLDIKKESGFVTVSYCQFSVGFDHNKTMLIGHSDCRWGDGNTIEGANKKMPSGTTCVLLGESKNNAVKAGSKCGACETAIRDGNTPPFVEHDDLGEGALHVTFHHNWFAGDSRSPRLRFGLIHAFNNYYDRNKSYCIMCVMRATMLVEANYFDNADDAYITNDGADTDLWDYTQYDGEGEIYVSETDSNIYDNTDVDVQLIEQNLPINYTYTIDDANTAKDDVINNAGASSYSGSRSVTSGSNSGTKSVTSSSNSDTNEIYTASDGKQYKRFGASSCKRLDKKEINKKKCSGEHDGFGRYITADDGNHYLCKYEGGSCINDGESIDLTQPNNDPNVQTSQNVQTSPNVQTSQSSNDGNKVLYKGSYYPGSNEYEMCEWAASHQRNKHCYEWAGLKNFLGESGYEGSVPVAMYCGDTCKDADLKGVTSNVTKTEDLTPGKYLGETLHEDFVKNFEENSGASKQLNKAGLNWIKDQGYYIDFRERFIEKHDGLWNAKIDKLVRFDESTKSFY